MANHTKRAIELAREAVLAREDRNQDPEIMGIDMTHDGFIVVDIQYHTKGHCALYEYRIRDGAFSLAQD
jgi:hypothetical protein